MASRIKQIIAGRNIHSILFQLTDRLYKQGPISSSDLETASLLSLYHNEYFSKCEEDILLYMGLFYKPTHISTLRSKVFELYKEHLISTYQHNYTPIQGKITSGIQENRYYSFSAPTSTGKSYVFMQQIKRCAHDVVVVVPSRALINEYFLKISEEVRDPRTNVLTFIEKINTKNSDRNIFIVTPERCRELFKYKDEFQIDLFLFDEAQLGDDDTKRGLYFDSIIRRCRRSFPTSKFVFSQPFVSNPESQITKNHFIAEASSSDSFSHRNVGQLYMCRDNTWRFYHFGIDKKIMGSQKVLCRFDPLEKILSENGSILFYVSKSSIFDGSFLNEFERYISLCSEINSDLVNSYVDKIQKFTGGNARPHNEHYSRMLDLLRRGIVVHHGSMPLPVRLLIERFTKEGHCRLCFATSTLEQGINMPFDAVYLDRLEASKPLAVKNLIGRAGRSSSEGRFDYGYVILGRPSQMTAFRTIMNRAERLKEISSLESSEDQNPDLQDFKESVLDGSFSDELNLTPKEIEKISQPEAKTVVELIIDAILRDGGPVPISEIDNDQDSRLALYDHFSSLYSIYLGRPVATSEQNVLTTAVKIMLWRIHGKSFKNICWFRYAHASRAKLRESIRRSGSSTETVLANYVTGYHDIPNIAYPVHPLFPRGTRADEVDYDRIMYDTYDYIDKLIGFRLSDIFCAAFQKYYETTGDSRAVTLSNYIRYGTDKSKQIWLLRYGVNFEDMDEIEPHVIDVDASQITFRRSILDLGEDTLWPIRRFIENSILED